MWITRMSPSSPSLSVDNREPKTASPGAVAPRSEGDGEAYAAQQATITQSSSTPAVQDSDESIEDNAP